MSVVRSRSLLLLLLLLASLLLVSVVRGDDESSATTKRRTSTKTKRKKRKRADDARSDPRNAVYGLLSPRDACPDDAAATAAPTTWATFAVAHDLMDDTEEHVVIPCGTHVRVEPGDKLRLRGGLAIKGKLSIDARERERKDDDDDDVVVESTYVLVLGYLEVRGSSRRRVVFRLFDRPDRASLVVTEGLPWAHDFGRKAFVVLGGRSTVVGDDDDDDAPAFAELERTAVAGETELLVVDDLSTVWRPGDRLGVASGSRRSDATDEVVVEESTRTTTRDGRVATRLRLRRPLEHDHAVRSVAATDGSGRTIRLRPEVIKLNRNVIVEGVLDAPPTPTDTTTDTTTTKPRKPKPVGGHLVISHTALPQQIEAVEFRRMGQAGKAGRYPIHYHFGGYVPDGSTISRNSVVDSFQRCINVHATHGLLVRRNVAFRARGHCFVAAEDGVETDNRLVGNVAMDVRRAIKPALVPFGEGTTTSDDEPAGAWSAHPGNHLVDNVVAGSANAGVWYESFGVVRGESAHRKLVDADPADPRYDPKTRPFGTFRNNRVHSCAVGLNPGHGRAPPEHASFEDLFAWSTDRAVHTGGSVRLGLTGAVLVDFRVCGVSAVLCDGLWMRDSLVVGELPREDDAARDAPCDDEDGDDRPLRDVAGVRLSPAVLADSRTPARPFLLQRVHFQHLSETVLRRRRRRRDCPGDDPNKDDAVVHRTAVEIFLNDEQTWSLHSVVESISFDPDTVDTRWVAHNFHDVDRVGVVALRVGGDAPSGRLPPGGTVVNVGWEGWEAATVGCRDMEPMGEGLNLVHCPSSCWRRTVVEFEESRDGRGTTPARLEITSAATGLSWTLPSTPRRRGDDADPRERAVVVRAPAGNYDVRFVDGTTGEPLDARDAPEPRAVDADAALGYDVCAGSIGLTVANVAS